MAEQSARETHLRHQTRRDALTGLANRVLLQERLEELLAEQIPLAVVFCDLDQFKRINDTHGHAAGDEVLRVMGTRLARRLAAADVVARIGGDEFVVVAAGVEQHDAPGLLRRIEGAFTSDPVQHRRPAPGRVVLAWPGVRAWRRGVRPGSAAERAQELLSNADREMYAHKRSRVGVQRLLQLAANQPGSPRSDLP